MEKMILVFHLLTAVAIIGFILLQQGKGAEAGASFGAGASQTVFGSSGSWNFFSRVTAILAVIFFLTSLGLAIIARNNAGVTSEAVLPELEIVDPQPAEQGEIPAMVEEATVEQESATAEDGAIPEAETVPEEQ